MVAGEESELLLQARNALNPNVNLSLGPGEVSGDSGGRVSVTADQTISGLNTQPETTLFLAPQSTLTVTTPTEDDASLIRGDVAGAGNLAFTGNGELVIIVDLDESSEVYDGGVTTFTGRTSVNGGGTLYLLNTDALGGSEAMSISHGSTVSVLNFEDYAGVDADGVSLPRATDSLNTAMDVDLDIHGDSPATLEIGADQKVDSLTAGTEGTVKINDSYTFKVGQEGGDSTIEGEITGDGDFVITGGAATIERTGRVETGLEVSNAATLVNSGTIEASSEADSVAIRAGVSGDAVVILDKGSKVIGDIKSENADNILRINVGSAQSVMYGTSGDWTLESIDGRPVVEGSIMAAGIGNLETVDEQMHRRSVDLRNSLTRLGTRMTDGSGIPILIDAYQGVENRSAGGGAADTTEPVAAETLSGYRLETHGATLATRFGKVERGVSLFINFTDNAMNVADDVHRIDSRTIRLGASATSLVTLGDIGIGGRVLIGRSEYDGNREVLINTAGSSGATRQRADWESDVWELALNAGYRQALSETVTLAWTPEVSIHEERIDAYQESARFEWDARNVMQGRASFDAALDYQTSARSWVSAGLTAWHREVIDGETGQYAVADTRVSYEDPQATDQGLSVRLGYDMQLSESLSLATTAATHRTNADTDGWLLGVALAGRF
jgi:uncharacterized protein YhjY with autotransporter beta-barrel domain